MKEQQQHEDWSRLPAQPAQSQLNLLSLLGFTSEVSRETSRRQAVADEVRDIERRYVDRFPSLHQIHNTVARVGCEDVLRYKNNLAQVRKVKDVAFTARGATMAEVADRVTEELWDSLLLDVADDFEKFVSECSEQLLDKM